ncbi:DUF637 domain-containing protein [Variovorax sp. J22G21]|uniref:DUF637 domain-containing protein n=1 Tax=Variovorax fucosicus TaxID=3053517 RepID=UPI00336536B4|nr:DUF637 domain-containing protein [Variovorax sp. J22G21]
MSVLSWGTASAWGASAAQGVGFTSTAAGTAGGAFAGAVAAGISSIASQAAVSLINNNGNVGAVIEELTSSQGIRRIVTAMATAGAVQGLDAGLGIGGWTANGAAAGTASWPQVLGRNLLDGVAGGLVYAAVNGTSAEDAIRNGLLNGLLNTAASGSAQWIGGNAQGFANAFAHAIAGCVVGAGRANLGGAISGGDGCSAGAIGAVVGDLAAQFYDPNRTGGAATVQFGQLIGGLAGALVGGNQASADIASQAAGNAVENNYLAHNPNNGRSSQLRGFAEDLARCKATVGCDVEGVYAYWSSVGNTQQQSARDAIANWVATGQASALGQVLADTAGAMGANPGDYCAAGDARCYQFIQQQNAQSFSVYRDFATLGISMEYVSGPRPVANIPGFTAIESATIREAQSILSSTAIVQIEAAHATGQPAAVVVGGRLIQYEPGLPASGMTLFGENGFLIGREAFASAQEFQQTILHELYRLNTSAASAGVSGTLATRETADAATFAARAVGQMKR